MAAAAVAAAAAACSGCTNRACIWPRSIKKEEDEQDENEGSRCGGQRRASCSVRRTSSTRRTIYRATGDAARGRRVLTGRRWRRRGCSCVCSGTPRVSATPPLLRVRASPTHLPPPVWQRRQAPMSSWPAWTLPRIMYVLVGISRRSGCSKRRPGRVQRVEQQQMYY